MLKELSRIVSSLTRIAEIDILQIELNQILHGEPGIAGLRGRPPAFDPRT
jgi:hypothetical protein